MSNQIFHFSNTGISSGQRFYLKDNVSGIFLNKLNINSDRKIEAPNLVYNTGNQTISGEKTFNNFLFLNNDLYSNSDLYARHLYINSIFDQEDSSSILEMHAGSIVLKPNYAGEIGYVSIEPRGAVNGVIPEVELRVKGGAYARNLVYNTGNQTISGVKTFASRPTVNGTGVLLSGEAINISFVSPPATPNSAGTSGQIALDANYAYYCISNNNWRRSAISSW